VSPIDLPSRATTLATDERYELAEGPWWDAARSRLWWVDILSGALLEGTLADGVVTVLGHRTFDGSVSAVATSETGTVLVALRDRLVLLLPDGSTHPGPVIVADASARRLNDGSPDPAGRYLVGTLRDGSASHAATDSAEELSRWDGRTVMTIDGDLDLSNGLAWSTDGSLMYSVDSLRHAVYRRPYDVESGWFGPRDVHLTVSGGLPDGIAVDAADHLWVAVWGAGEVRRHDPDGQLIERIEVPAPHVSNVAFAGADLRDLVITTARAELSSEDLAKYPASGALFTVRVDVPGHPVAYWASPISHPGPSR
jgi:sugar lactone lactonase YvrE